MKNRRYFVNDSSESAEIVSLYFKLLLHFHINMLLNSTTVAENQRFPRCIYIHNLDTHLRGYDTPEGTV
jgi:hypothetical protein